MFEIFYNKEFLKIYYNTITPTAEQTEKGQKAVHERRTQDQCPHQRPQNKNHSKTADLPTSSLGAPAKRGLAGGIVQFLPFNPAARACFLLQRGSHLNQGPHDRAQSAPRRPSDDELWPWDGVGPAAAADGAVLACDVTCGRRAAAPAGHTAPTCALPKSRKQDKRETGEMRAGPRLCCGIMEMSRLLCTVVSTRPLYSQRRTRHGRAESARGHGAPFFSWEPWPPNHRSGPFAPAGLHLAGPAVPPAP